MIGGIKFAPEVEALRTASRQVFTFAASREAFTSWRFSSCCFCTVSSMRSMGMFDSWSVSYLFTPTMTRSPCSSWRWKRYALAAISRCG